MKRFGALAVLWVAVASGCGGDDDEPPTAGERLCRKAHDCPQFDVQNLVECARQFDEDFFPRVSAACASCVQGLSCAAWPDIDRGVSFSSFCRDCPE